MIKMAEGFKAIRLAELELAGEYNSAKHDDFFARFGWEQFTDDEWELCPPVVAVGGDGAMYDIGFQNLSRALMSGKPIKVLVLDTQVYSNTGGQACTSGFFGQVSDMAAYGAADKGKKEVAQGDGSDRHGASHHLRHAEFDFASQSHDRGLHSGVQNAPASPIQPLRVSCQPEHGIGDDKSVDQAKLAVESRAYPIFRYDPDEGLLPGRVLRPGGQPGDGPGLARLQVDLPGRPT